MLTKEELEEKCKNHLKTRWSWWSFAQCSRPVLPDETHPHQALLSLSSSLELHILPIWDRFEERPQLVSLILNPGCRNHHPFTVFWGHTTRREDADSTADSLPEVGRKSPSRSEVKRFHHQLRSYYFTCDYQLCNIPAQTGNGRRCRRGSEETWVMYGLLPLQLWFGQFPPSGPPTCPSTKSSPAQTVQEAAAFHPRNRCWQARVTISGPRAAPPCPPATAAPIFDKLWSFGGFLLYSRLHLSPKSLPFLYHILRAEPKSISIVTIEVAVKQKLQQWLVGASLSVFISWHSGITAVWRCSE